MKPLELQTRLKIEAKDDRWVEIATTLAYGLDKEMERQLRNVQSVAEQSDSFKAIDLFIRYQAARRQLKLKRETSLDDWIKALRDLEADARGIAGPDPEKARLAHLAIVNRVLGFAVRACVAINKNVGPREVTHGRV